MSPHTIHSSQRGAATLFVTLMLFFAMAIAAFGLSRHLIVEQRISANQARAAQAFEAAEAGLEWAQAQLNDVEPVGADCKPAKGAGATSFLSRMMTLDRITSRYAPTSVHPTCALTPQGWTCSCTGDVPDAPGGLAPSPAFALRFVGTAAPGGIRVIADGCTQLAGPCAPSAGSTADGIAHGEVTLALLAGLRTAPSLAFTTRDAMSQTAAQFFAGTFGMAKATWRDQPVVARIACGADCGDALAEAIDAGHALIWVDGDLTIAGPRTLGSTAQPIVIVASGQARLDGAVTVVGALYASTVSVSSSNAGVQGAVFSEEDSAAAATAAHRDADVLAILSRQTGSFVRINGSWRDF